MASLPDTPPLIAPLCDRAGGNARWRDLGRLDPEHFLGGSFRLNLQQAEESFAEFLRRTSQPRRKHGARFKTPVHLARGIVAVANATMERALRVISVERGHDPRDFALVCFGGAGGLHAADLARALGLVRVIVPQNPGAFSALGVLLSDIIKDVSHSVLIPVPGADASANVARHFGDRNPPKRRRAPVICSTRRHDGPVQRTNGWTGLMRRPGSAKLPAS